MASMASTVVSRSCRLFTRITGKPKDFSANSEASSCAPTIPSPPAAEPACLVLWPFFLAPPMINSFNLSLLLIFARASDQVRPWQLS